MRSPLLFVALITLPTLAHGALPWKRIIGADTSSLSSADRAKAAKLMGEINNYYGCSDSVATCLTSSPNCLTARHVAGQIVRMVQKGRSAKAIKRAIMLRSKSAHPFRKKSITNNLRQCLGNPKTAKVVIHAFSDFQCPFCQVILPRVEAIARQHADVALCYKNFPTVVHGQGTVVSSWAAVAASLQGKFWEYHALLYKNRRNQSRNSLLSFARAIKLNIEQFLKDFKARKTKKIVAKEKAEGIRLGVKGTPTLFFNGKLYYGRKNTALLLDRIAEERFLRAGKQ